LHIYRQPASTTKSMLNYVSMDICAKVDSLTTLQQEFHISAVVWLGFELAVFIRCQCRVDMQVHSTLILLTFFLVWYA